jgi:hypothetical protein
MVVRTAVNTIGRDTLNFELPGSSKLGDDPESE